jgi:hypothetical protein
MRVKNLMIPAEISKMIIEEKYNAGVSVCDIIMQALRQYFKDKQEDENSYHKRKRASGN